MWKIVGLIIAAVAASAASEQPRTVPHTLCAKSDTWMRPSADVQSKIWNDNRYKDHWFTSYAWTHDFIWSAADSASIAYHNGNVTGLWTAEMPASRCPRRGAEPWTEIWALNHHVTGITIDGLEFTVTAEHRDSGFEIIQFRRPRFLGESLTTMRFMNGDRQILDEWYEARPGIFEPRR